MRQPKPTRSFLVTTDAHEPATRRRRAPRVRPNLGVEALEDRTVPAVAQPLGPTGLNVAAFAQNSAAQVGTSLYFLGTDAASGGQTLWRTDGTVGQTSKLTGDATYSGLVGLAVSEVAAVDGSVYFTAAQVPVGGQSLASNVELWKLNPGAPGGVTKVTTSTGIVGNLKAAGSNLFYSVSPIGSVISLTTGPTLWAYDGASAPRQLAFFPSFTTFPEFTGATAAGSNLYFWVNSTAAGSSSALWLSNGTVAGTRAITGAGTPYTDLAPIGRAAVVGSKLFFTAASGANGELWAADGSALTRVKVFSTPSSAPVSESVHDLTTDGTRALLVAPTTGGTTVWMSDGTATGTTAVFAPSLLPAGVSSQSIGQLWSAGPRLFFTVIDSSRGGELWKFEGGAVTLVKDIKPGMNSSNIQGLGVYDGAYYFAAEDGVAGQEVWRSDGTAGGTRRLTDFNPGLSGSSPTGLRKVNSNLLVTGLGGTAAQGAAGAYKLWQVPTGPVVAASETTTTLAGPAGGATSGRPVTLTATVTPQAGGGSPSGQVAFRNTYTVFGTAPVVRGQAVFDVSNLLPMAHTLQAVYLGDATFNGSPSATVPLMVAQAPATVNLSASPTTINSGQLTTLTANVQPAQPGGAAPTGMVTFFDAADSTVILGTANLVNGTAAIQATWQTWGPHVAVARYYGDVSYGQASGNSPAIQVAADAAVTLTMSAASAAFGQSVTLTGRVAPVRSGLVSFMDGATEIGRATVNSGGTATLSTSALRPGSHDLRAVFHGALGQTASPGKTLTVQGAATTTTLQAAAAGQQATLTATVAPAGASAGPMAGQVEFRDGATILGTGAVSGGQATLSATLAAGAHSLSARFTGSTDYTPSTSANVALNITQPTVATTTTLQATATGQQATLTATVAPAAASTVPLAGQIEFRNGTTVLGTRSISGGQATLSVTLASGLHNLSARFVGSTGHTASTSADAPLTISPTATATTTTLQATAAGQQATLTATVAPTAVAGQVEFRDGGTVLGTSTVGGGQATLTATLAGGSHSLTARFTGSTDHAPSTSSAVTLNITQPAVATTTALISSAPSATAGDSVTFTATVRASAGTGIPTGSVAFRDGSTLLGTVSLDGNGSAALTTSALAAGQHAITAAYTGTAGFTASTSAAVAQTIAESQNVIPATTTTLSATTPSAMYGQSVTLTATVAPMTGTTKPGGTVQFRNGAAVLGTAPITNGVATFKLPVLPAGSHLLRAIYGGSTSFGTSGAAVTLTVAKAQTTAALAVSKVTVAAGQEQTFTATIAVRTPGGGAPAGRVSFYDGATEIGSAVVSGGKARLTVKLPPGLRRMQAVYRGDSNFAAANSNAGSVTVQTPTLTTVTAPASAYGYEVALKATVVGLAPGSGKASGRVTFKDGTTILGTATVTNGVAQLTVNGLATGTHSISAVYETFNGFLGSASAPLSYGVGRGTAVLAFFTQPATAGVAIRGNVITNGTNVARPTGKVTFKEGTVTLGTVDVNAAGLVGIALQLTKGQHNLTVFYSGDTRYLASSAPVVVNVA